MESVSKEKLFELLGTSNRLYKGAKAKMNEVAERHSEFIQLAGGTGLAIGGGGIGGHLDKAYPDAGVFNIPLPMLLGAGLTAAGLVGANSSGRLPNAKARVAGLYAGRAMAAFGGGLLAWEAGKLAYAKTDPPQVAAQGAVGGYVGAAQPAAAFLPPAQAQPVYAPALAAAPARALAPAPITVAELEQQWAAMGAV